MNREFYWEYMKECDNLINRFLKETKSINSKAFKVAGADIEKAVANFLWQNLFHNKNKESYSNKRIEGKAFNHFIEEIWNTSLHPLLPSLDNITESKIINSEDNNYQEVLNLDAILFYCKNNRQLEYYLPILNKIEERVVILTLEELNESLLIKHNIEIIKFGVISKPIFIEQKYLEEKFPFLFSLTDILFLLIKTITPKKIIILEGCHYETEIISSISKVYSIKTICIQQGWPSLMHTRFINMTYDYFLTWGKEFNKLWGKYNSFPIFIETGYLYEVNKRDKKEKKSITFFFQAPLFTISNIAFQEMIEFAFFCAEQFPYRKILIREHPEYRFTSKIMKRILKQNNIKLVTDNKIHEVFSQTEIGVSFFSSTLMEGIVHNIIPFVFNPTSNPKYYPDIDKERLGLEVKTFAKAKEKILHLLKTELLKQNFKKNISKNKKIYFECVELETANKILQIIKL